MPATDPDVSRAISDVLRWGAEGYDYPGIMALIRAVGIDWWQERQMWARYEREARQARARLDARWIRLPYPADMCSPKLPPAGMPVLILGWAEVFGQWSHDFDHGIYHRVEVIRRGAWWSSIDHFVIERSAASDDVGIEVVAWQPVPSDADRWIAATQLPEKVYV